MFQGSPDIQPGKKVVHPELGEGVVVGLERTGFATVFFRSYGERQVPPDSLSAIAGWIDRVIAGIRPACPAALERLHLAVEAAALPLMESAATLTSAKVDLLPHQVVIVYRVANAQPRRFLIADEVGLGKTIETALILRELASRGEIRRALMVVPAGLVDNWRRELNDVFNLDFEVLGFEGDITDRKSNAFEKHNRLIVSIDTLKRTRRVRRLLAAPPWDLVVFDEAHHLSVYKSGNKTKKTENFKLAEALKNHCRDLLLLSATPHQGDHFRFWMLIRLLQSGLFRDEQDMVLNRHRLNAAVIRRTKADACSSDGSPLFARRIVHTEGFTLSEKEKIFYNALLDYLREGYDLAEKQGKKGRALGFVMTVFQKIAASSFAAVKSTLERRLLMLTIREAIERDEMLDVDGRDSLFSEARSLIIQMHNLPNDILGRAQAEQILAESKVQLLKKMKETASYIRSSESYDESEFAADKGEESATLTVALALPEERKRIRELLTIFPDGEETKTLILIDALSQLWQMNPAEKIVVFTTYLGSIGEMRDAITRTFPQKGVEILKGGDHGAKIAAQRRFKREDGPQVLLCTAAGREGINLQFSRILFNYDLPWNPMDLEQRIGRIHRYGQKDTAQVYNLVATDTIEGQIFLLLEDKLQGIAEALGKIDERGQIKEDFRSQVLGQLGDRLSYDRLYQEAILDPTLRRTRQEIETAMENATLAREVVFELFQDLEKFKLGDYRHIDDQGRGMKRLEDFVKRAAYLDGGAFIKLQPHTFELRLPERDAVKFTTERDMALEQEHLHLLGLEHPIIKAWLEKYESLPAEERFVFGRIGDNGQVSGLITTWRVIVHGQGREVRQRILNLGITPEGHRSAYLERLSTDILKVQQSNTAREIDRSEVSNILNGKAGELLHREIHHSGLLQEGASYSSQLLACIEVLGD
jgi:ERCC4-related helicase